MPNHDPRAIANEFLKLRANDSWPSQVLLQKLTYMAHGWNLAINGEALVNERPEAWDNGPVFRSIWDHIKQYGYKGPNCELTDPKTNQPIEDELTSEERQVIEHVWRKYGTLPAGYLSDLTHQPDTPWSSAYLKARNALLSNQDIRDHYVRLGLAGRRANA